MSKSIEDLLNALTSVSEEDLQGIDQRIEAKQAELDKRVRKSTDEIDALKALRAAVASMGAALKPA